MKVKIHACAQDWIYTKRCAAPCCRLQLHTQIQKEDRPTGTTHFFFCVINPMSLSKKAIQPEQPYPSKGKHRPTLFKRLLLVPLCDAGPSRGYLKLPGHRQGALSFRRAAPHYWCNVGGVLVEKGTGRETCRTRIVCAFFHSECFPNGRALTCRSVAAWLLVLGVGADLRGCVMSRAQTAFDACVHTSKE